MPDTDEIILKRRETCFQGNKPCCPKCKPEEDQVIITNVTVQKFECLRCKDRKDESPLRISAWLTNLGRRQGQQGSHLLFPVADRESKNLSR